MSKELVISANRHETRVAMLEDDQLVEVYFQRANEYSLAGSIHKGRVTRVLPGMQSAFVDLGLERDTFLYVSDFLEEHEDFDKITDEDEGRGRGGREHRRQREAAPPSAEPSTNDAAEVENGGIAAEAYADGETAPDEVRAGEPTASTTPAPSSSSALTQQGGHDSRERRGRRSRRRRGRRGLPDAKYASQSGAGGPDALTAEPADDGRDDDEAGNDRADTAAAEEAPIILPGESLAKYRQQANRPVTPVEKAAPPAPALESDWDEPSDAPLSTSSGEEDGSDALEINGLDSKDVENEFDEPIHYPPENALPDAPKHQEPEAPQIPAQAAKKTRTGLLASLFGGSLFSGDEPVTLSPAASSRADLPPAQPPAYVVTPSSLGALEEQVLEEDDTASGADDVEESDEDQEAPAVASLLDDDEDRDIQAMILGDVEGIELSPINEGEEGDETPGEETVESGTAVVRERGGRFPHRVSRRRRRGRGNRPEGRPTGARSQADGEAKPVESRGEQTVSRPAARFSSRPNQQQPLISDLLKAGQEIIVQIAKEPLGAKGARITSHIALPGRYVVYMPTLEHMGVSRKIASDEERYRLKKVLQNARPGPVGGFITRTAAEGRTEEEIAGDMQFLYNLWQDIKNKADKKPAPALLHHDLDIVQRILRDQLADSFKAIWIDSEETYENVLSFVERFQPALVPKVKLYTREAPIFDAFGVTNELEKALRPKVWLKSGGFIVINQTEALVAVDVNTGKYVGKTNRLEDTIVKTNTEAIKEIVRQIRLRDLGGIIVIDFIDMDERKNRQKVMQALEEAMRADRAPYKILQFNDFGLVAITRKRVKQSLERTLCSPCPHCEGAGYIKSTQTVIGEILVEARKISKSVEGKDVMLRVHPDVAKVLKSHQNKHLEELEEILRRPVLVKSDPQMHNEKFDLA